MSAIKNARRIHSLASVGALSIIPLASGFPLKHQALEKQDENEKTPVRTEV